MSSKSFLEWLTKEGAIGPTAVLDICAEGAVGPPYVLCICALYCMSYVFEPKGRVDYRMSAGAEIPNWVHQDSITHSFYEWSNKPRAPCKEDDSYSNTGGPPLPRKRAPLQKETKTIVQCKLATPHRKRQTETIVKTI